MWRNQTYFTSKDSVLDLGNKSITPTNYFLLTQLLHRYRFDAKTITVVSTDRLLEASIRRTLHSRM